MSTTQFPPASGERARVRGSGSASSRRASSTPDTVASLIKTEVPKWRKIVKDAGAKVG